MKKLCIIVFFLFLISQSAYAASNLDFYKDVTWKLFDFTETKDRKFTSTGDSGEETEVYQGKNSIAVTYFFGGDSYAAFFKTRDPQIIFIGDVKVGASLKDIVDKKLIPGKMTKIKALSKGKGGYRWIIREKSSFSVYTNGDTISEIVFYDPAFKLKVDVNRIKYAD